MSQPVVSCQSLCKTYHAKPPVEALRGIDLEVVAGECMGVLGPNGAGKTTAIEIMEDLLEPSSGWVEILGKGWDKDGHAIRQQIGISLQETQFSDKLTVAETLTLFRSFYQQGTEPREAMARVSLEEKADAYVKTLSGGQKQRLAVAVALAGAPQLLFLDEPTTGLDPNSRRELWQIIGDFREDGRSVLLTTHYMEEAERLCDRVAIIDRGKIIALGTPAQLIERIGGEHIIELTFDADTPAPTAEEWKSLPAVVDASRDNEHLLLTTSEPHVSVAAALERVSQCDLALASLSTRHTSLEDVFVHLTGRHLDDEGVSSASSA